MQQSQYERAGIDWSQIL